MSATIDPGIVTLVQSTFLAHINSAFSIVSAYAFKLLYIFATFELVIMGLAWALQRDAAWSKIFFKIIKIGIIFFTIQNYPILLDSIISSFAKLSGIVINSSDIAQYIFNPATIWEYGYNIGVNLLETSYSSNAVGPALIYLSLGIGILLVFGLLGILLIVQMVGFYLVSFTALIFSPFGAISIGSNMFDRSIRSVLQAGARLMSLIIIIGIAVTIWEDLNVIDLATSTDFNINQPLGLFFSALLFLCLAFYLPNIVSQVIGSISSRIDDTGTQSITSSYNMPATSPGIVESGVSNLQAATVIATAGAGPASEVISSTAQAAMMPSQAFSGSLVAIDSQGGKNATSQASTISRSISESTIKRVKEAVLEATKGKNQNS